MSLELPYDHSLNLKIDDLHYANSGPATLEFTLDTGGNAFANITVYLDVSKTQVIVSKGNLAVNPIPFPPGPKGAYFFQFNLLNGNPKVAARDHAGYLPGTYTFNFVPSLEQPLSGTISDPHTESDDSQWTASIPQAEEEDAIGVGGSA